MSNELKLRFATGAKVGEIIYLSALSFNGLFQYNLITETLEFIQCFDLEENKSYLHRKAYLYKNEIWFIPECGNYISILNLNTMKIEYIDIVQTEYSDEWKYLSSLIIEDNYLCLTPWNNYDFIAVNMDNKRIEFRKGLKKETEYSGIVYVDGKIYMYPYRCSYKKKEKAVLDWKKKILFYEEWNVENETCGESIYVEKYRKIYHSNTKSKNVLVENLELNKIELIRCNNGNYDNYTYFMANIRDKIFLLNWDETATICIDPLDNSVERYEIIEQKDETNHFCRYIDSKDRLYVIRDVNNELIEIDEKGVIKKRKILIQWDVLKRQITESGCKDKFFEIMNTILYEENIDLSLYMYLIEN